MAAAGIISSQRSSKKEKPMYKKYVSASGTAYVFDSCTNNIYEIDDKEKFASLPKDCAPSGIA